MAVLDLSGGRCPANIVMRTQLVRSGTVATGPVQERCSEATCQSGLGRGVAFHPAGPLSPHSDLNAGDTGCEVALRGDGPLSDQIPPQMGM